MLRGMITVFDAALVKQVGRMPPSFHVPFVWLGRFTSPILWASYLVMFTLIRDATGAVPPETLLILLVLPLATVMKLFIRRQRPPTLYAENMRVRSYSFPSSHAYSAALAGGYVGQSLLGAGLMLGGMVTLLVVLVIGISRIALGAHYPSDVVSGWIMGALALLLVLSL